jgi:hypothetical protein
MSLDFLGGPATREFEPRGWLARLAGPRIRYPRIDREFFSGVPFSCLPDFEANLAIPPDRWGWASCPACQMVTPPQQTQSGPLIGSWWFSEGNVAVKLSPTVVCRLSWVIRRVW